MQVKLKHLLCLTALGIFLFMGLASDFLDESTNVSVNIKPGECESRPSFTGKLTVNVTNNGGVIGGPNWLIEVSFVNQKINDTINCTSFYQHNYTQQAIIVSGFSNTFETPTFTHDNKSDLWRIAIQSKFAGTEDWSHKEVKVVFYDQTQLSFNVSTLPPL